MENKNFKYYKGEKENPFGKEIPKFDIDDNNKLYKSCCHLFWYYEEHFAHYSVGPLKRFDSFDEYIPQMLYRCEKHIDTNLVDVKETYFTQKLVRAH